MKIKDSCGINRPATEVICDYCRYPFLKQTRLLREKNYCNRECQSEAQVTGKNYPCEVCKKKIYRNISQAKKSKSGMFFCSKECKDIGVLTIQEIRPEFYDTGISDYRTIAFREYPKICSICGYNNEKALEVHHLDKDRNNNSVYNLIVLCCNCHTLIHKGFLAEMD